MSEKTVTELENLILEIEHRIEDLENASLKDNFDRSAEVKYLREKRERLQTRLCSKLTPYDIVKIARHPLRPLAADYVNMMMDDFVELHGDKRFGDDKAIICGLGSIGRERILFVGQQKGKSTKERIACNFGMPNPEGYRKALQKMKLAEKFHLPIVTLIDTPGANPDIGAEERGQAHAIAENIYEMCRLKTPIINVVIGEGGSGGALGIGIGDKFAILEYAYYSVISPEGCAAILWKNAENAPESARSLQLTAKDLLNFGIADEIVPEPLGAAHKGPKEMAGILKARLLSYLEELKGIPVISLVESRYERYRKMGEYLEE
ncbi:MAG: acetyl-CoA carboxylase carboxyltransferase subunit alpha [Candidatus Brocadia sp. AMX2]|uniref:Acetyl-coenzyme A carboxylase carboxyl transferase subunit alpha n=1 Tax=Candidatus Brocadia sinica JPN1 TaxID=1197129 RepID=A0ABQ0K0U2_9BACT|nr:MULTISPECIES: acetyl-CoA carboxylase carboxyltransferase subunit alpha [Brocadia]KXK28793.1 MAG: acetyl-CoA carboxylase carboxyltransferase subunit [Candidatus Brocadia sinica]MBC6933648.1 acetyl-CoA carboxylase carboxyltransferase subunit alpha [Candidatus Brocadia sp.]MBL1170039.1 acetyl-CoA carboxylase carboxyltransferase subunit alpha [Candidatus Brocadia sp. AMX1]NOG42433.1 acetyl-CoA carboxylase carboxyltransferase subunit alpha [Planctomycetota bacterium]KAA0243336.1 MAG: acetyl-CoA 